MYAIVISLGELFYYYYYFFFKFDSFTVLLSL